MSRRAGIPYREIESSLVWNRGKKSVVLELSSEEGRKRARKLARSSDVVAESFLPGDAEALGLDYATLSADNPGPGVHVGDGVRAEGALRAVSSL